MKYEWDEAKRRANLEKHKLDLVASRFVYEHPDKLTLTSLRRGEVRKQDLALVEVLGVILSLVYVERADVVRCISLRRASREERQLYAQARP